MAMDNRYYPILKKHALSILREKGLWLMLHALLSDAIVLVLVAFAGLMTLESLMPGFVSAHINLAKILFAIAVLFLAHFAVGHAYHIPASEKRAPWWLLTILILWSSAIVISSLIKFPLYAIAIIFVFTAIIGKLLYDDFFNTE